MENERTILAWQQKLDFDNVGSINEIPIFDTPENEKSKAIFLDDESYTILENWAKEFEIPTEEFGAAFIKVALLKRIEHLNTNKKG